MIPREFDYRLSRSIGEACRTLLDVDGSVALAGGQSLIPLLKLRLARPDLVVDIGRVPGLGSIEVREDAVELGALVTVAEIEESPGVLRASPLWAEAAAAVADPLVRNAGTVGGNLAHADPLNDLPAALVAAGGSVVARGADRERSIDASDLFAGPFKTSLDRGELITRVLIPPSRAGAYEKFKRAAVDYGIAAVAVQLTLNDDGIVQQAGIAVTGSVEVACQATEAQQVLEGSTASPDDVASAASATASAMDFTADERGSARYKRALVETLTSRAINRALTRSAATGT